MLVCCACIFVFQPTLPARGATTPFPLPLPTQTQFQPTLPARGATVPLSVLRLDRHRISTHAPRTGSDAVRNAAREALRIISTHAPRTGSDGSRDTGIYRIIDFNPRSPHGERPLIVAASAASMVFQPTLPARGATMTITIALRLVQAFQPTLPARGATVMCASGRRRIRISTHAPRTGSDRTIWDSSEHLRHFNPRSPHGERRAASTTSRNSSSFQPTLPARGATARSAADSGRPIRISTHAPRTGSDDMLESVGHSEIDFNPRSPHGERHPRRRKSADC